MSDTQKIELELAELLTSVRRRRFVIAYVENGFNGTAAAEKAGFKRAAQSASDCLKSRDVQEAIKQYSAMCARNAGESRETIIDREVNWASGDIRDFFRKVPVLADDGTPAADQFGNEIFTEELVPITEWTKAQAQRVKKISWNRNGPVLELHDPMRANRNLAEYEGMLQKEDALLAPEDAASLIAAAMERMAELDAPESS